MSIHRAILSVVAVLFVLETARTQEPLQTAAPLSDGPLFFWSYPEDEGGKRIEVRMVLDPSYISLSSKRCMYAFWRGSGGFDLLHRLPGNRFLAEHRGDGATELSIVDLGKGTRDVLFSRKRFDFAGIAGERAVLHVDGELFAFEMKAGAEKIRLSERKLGRIIRFDARGILATDAVKESELLLIDPLKATTEIVGDLAGIAAMGFGRNGEISPSGKFVAAAYSLNPGWALRVFERATGKCVFEKSGFNLDVSPLSSQMPQLVFTWIDDGVIRYSETRAKESVDHMVTDGDFAWVDMEIATGKILREHIYGPMGLSHQKPPIVIETPPLRGKFGEFEVDGKKIFRKGESEPIVELKSDKASIFPEMSFSRDGAYVVFARCANRGDELNLIGGKAKEPFAFFKKWCYGLFWM